MNKYLSKERAMAVLDISERTIYRYMNSGVLRPAREGRKLVFLEEEVTQLKRVRDDPYIFNKDMIGMLLAKVQTLESQMSTVMRILNVKYETLELTAPEYRNLHLMADYYSLEGWPPHAEEQWADTFLRLRIEDLEELSVIAEDEHPWRPFLKLVTTMHLNSYDTNLRRQLAAGRTNVFQVAGIWCTLKGETAKTFDLLVQRDTEPAKKLVRKLQKRKLIPGES